MAGTLVAEVWVEQGRLRGRILLVADDIRFGGVLADALSRAGHRTAVVSLESFAQVAVERAAFRPDVVTLIVDDASATESFTETLGRDDAGAPFLVVTSSDRLEARLAAFAAGAEDVIVRPVAVPELDARLHVVLRRYGQVGGVLEVGDLLVDEQAHTVTYGGRSVTVTAIEFSLLATMIRERGRVLSKAQLLALVWGADHHDANVVEVHVSALRRKLEEHGPRVIHTVRGVGYVLRPPSEQFVTSLAVV